MKMNPLMLVVGSLLVFWASVSIIVIIPLATMHVEPSGNWLPPDSTVCKGLRLYAGNGCSYCHSLYVRTNDWGHGAERIAQAGDYNGQQPAILGTERTGPDLSEEGGVHPDGWHRAHFNNPRTTRPVSLMPSWEFLGAEKIDLLIAYMQYLGGKDARYRGERQRHWKKLAARGYEHGPDSNIAWLHDHIPEGWRPLPNPYPATGASLARGRRIFQQFCINCHGPVGDGNGIAKPWLSPPPLNFTTLRRNLVDDRYIGGILYYQIMNGITGTAMPFFKRDLESAKIWDVSNFVAASFIGYTDAGIAPAGIPAAYENRWKNTYPRPEASEEAHP